MNPTTTSVLYAVKADLETLRVKMDNYMYGGEKALETEDLTYCRRVYARICNVLDLL